MAKVTKEVMMEKLGALEDKLFDLVPENEVETPRARILDRVSEIVSGNVKVTLADMQTAFKQGSNLLAVEAEVKKAEKKQAKEDVADEKPKKKVSKKKSEPKEETSADLVPAQPKKVAKKSAKSEKEESSFEFPKVLETEEDGDYEQIKIKSIADIQEDDLIACQWTEEDLRDFDYDNTGMLGQPSKFDKDIDVLIVVDVYEDKIAYGLSVGTHKMYYFLPDEVKNMVSNGMPWRVYRAVN